MDKLIDNPWVVRAVSMALAILLFVSVNGLMNKGSSTTSSGMENNDVETIPNVPLELYYDSENLVVTGVPETVDVRIEGQRRFVEATKRQRDFTVYVDLSEAEIGNQRVPILYRDISDKLKVAIEPAYVDISLQEKVVEEFKVEVEYNRNILAEGYEAEKPEVTPQTVKIIGAKDVVEKVTYVKATIDASGLVSNTIRREANVTVLDRELNKLDVVIEPETVSVVIPVKNPSKNIPIKINTVGTPMDGIEILSVTPEVNEVIAFGRTETLQSLNEIQLEVDISNISTDTEVEIPIKYPDGVNNLSHEKIKVQIKAGKKEEKLVLNNIPVEARGLDRDLELAFIPASTSSVSVTVRGPEDVIQTITSDQLQVYFHADQLHAGEHNVDLLLDGPADLDMELSLKTVKIRLNEKENV